MILYSFRDMSYERECECMNTGEDKNMNKVLSTVYHVLSWGPRTSVLKNGVIFIDNEMGIE